MEGNSPNYLENIVMADIREALEKDFDQIWEIFNMVNYLFVNIKANVSFN